MAGNHLVSNGRGRFLGAVGMAVAMALLGSGGAAGAQGAAVAPVVALAGQVERAGKEAYALWTLLSLPQAVAIPSGASLVYEVLTAPGSVGRRGGVELAGGTVGELRDRPEIKDEAGEGIRGGAAQEAAAGQWYTRRFSLAPVAGQSFQQVQFFTAEMAPPVAGEYRAWVRRIRLEDAQGRTVAALMPAADATFTAQTVNMTVTAQVGAQAPFFGVPTNPVLSPLVRLIRQEPTQAGVTPAPTEQPEDLREISLAIPITNPAQSNIYTFNYLNYDQPQIIPPNAFLEYDIRFPEDTISATGGFDLESRPRIFFMLRGDPPIRDQNGIPCHFAANLAGFALGKWYRRRFSLATVAGKPFQAAFLSVQVSASKPGVYKAQYRRLRIVDAQGRVYWNFYPKLGALRVPVPGMVPPGSSFRAQGLVGVSLEPKSYLMNPGEALELQPEITNFDPAQAQRVTLTVQVEGGAHPLTLLPRTTLEVAAGGTTPLPRLTTQLPPGNYTAVAEFRVGDEQAVSRSQVFTVAARPEPPPAPGQLFTPGHIAWGADLIGFPDLSALAALRAHGANYANVFVPWGKVETRPGEYDFSLLDRMVAEAAQAHLQVEFFFITAGSDYPEWYRDEQMVDQEGKTFPGGPAVSYWAPTARAAFRKLVEAVVRRYRDNPVVAAYQFTFGGTGDAFYGEPGDGSLRLYDYSEYSQAKFREYVREVLGLSLAAAGKRYGLTLRTWQDLRQPVPQEGVDLRPIWWDFQNYRCWTVAKMWEGILQTVRRIDPRRMVEMDYGGSQEAIGLIGNDYDAAARLARQYHASIHNTCYEGYSAAPLLGTYARREGVVHSFETAGTPATYAAHQQAMFNLLLDGARGYYWIGVDAPPYSTFGQLRPAAEELGQALPRGPRLGLVQEISAYQCDLRMVTALRGAWEPARWAQTQGYNYDLFTDRRFLVDPPELDPATLPVIADYGLLTMTRPAIAALAAYARRGGTLLLTTASGRFAPGEPASRGCLGAAVGYAAAGTLPEGTGTADATGVGALQGTSLRLRSVAPLRDLPAGAEVLARFADGQTAAAQWKWGAGRVVMLAGAPAAEEPATSATLRKLLALSGLTPPASATDGVQVGVRWRGATAYLALHNPSDSAVETVVRLPGLAGPVRPADLVHRKLLERRTAAQLAAGLPLKLAPHEVLALALDPAREPARSFPPLDYPEVTSNPEAVPAPPVAAGAALQPITPWLVAGPFRNPDWFQGASFYQVREPEINPNPGAVYHDGDREIRWQKVAAPEGALRLADLFPFDTKTLAYAETDLVAAQPTRVRLSLGVDWEVELWLNGDPIFDANALPHPPSADSMALEIPLRAGRNRLLAKVAPGSLGWTFYAKWAPAAGVEVQLPEQPAS